LRKSKAFNRKERKELPQSSPRKPKVEQSGKEWFLTQAAGIGYLFEDEFL
jgi:hypothetical protein